MSDLKYHPVESDFAKQAASSVDRATITTDFGDRGVPSAKIKKDIAFNTHIRPDVGESTAYNKALLRGEIGLKRPLYVNKGGVDFITAARDSNGRMWILANDAKTSGIPKFPIPVTELKWRSEIEIAIRNISMGDTALEAEIREAYRQGRVQMRQLNVDYSNATLSVSKTGEVPVDGWGEFKAAHGTVNSTGAISRMTGPENRTPTKLGRIKTDLKNIAVRIKRVALYKIPIPKGTGTWVIRGIAGLAKGLIIGLVLDYLIRKMFGGKSIEEQLKDAMKIGFDEHIQNALLNKNSINDINQFFQDSPGKNIYAETIWEYVTFQDGINEKLEGIQLLDIYIKDHFNQGKNDGRRGEPNKKNDTWKHINRYSDPLKLVPKITFVMSVPIQLILPNDIFGTWIIGKSRHKRPLTEMHPWGCIKFTIQNGYFKVEGFGITLHQRKFIFERLVINIANASDVANGSQWLDLEITSQHSNDYIKISLEMKNKHNWKRTDSELYLKDGTREHIKNLWVRPEKWVVQKYFRDYFSRKIKAHDRFINTLQLQFYENYKKNYLTKLMNRPKELSFDTWNIGDLELSNLIRKGRFFYLNEYRIMATSSGFSYF